MVNSNCKKNIIFRQAFFPVTFRCNNNCIFCYNSSKIRSKELSTREIFKALRKLYYHYCVRTITFSGGEFIIRKDALKIIKYTRKLGFQNIRLFSNGRLLADEKNIRNLLKAGVNCFVISIHGHRASLHNVLTRTNSFLETFSAIINLKRLGCRVDTNTVITKSNYVFLPQITAFLNALRVDKIYLTFVLGYGKASRNATRIIPKMTDIAPYLKGALEVSPKAFAVNIPICILGEEYKNRIGYCDNNLSCYDIDFGIEIFQGSDDKENTLDFINKQKLKKRGLRCSKCSFFYDCKLPFEVNDFSHYLKSAFGWKDRGENYIDLYGWKEFRPISTSSAPL